MFTAYHPSLSLVDGCVTPNPIMKDFIDNVDVSNQPMAVGSLADVFHQFRSTIRDVQYLAMNATNKQVSGIDTMLPSLIQSFGPVCPECVDRSRLDLGKILRVCDPCRKSFRQRP